MKTNPPLIGPKKGLIGIQMMFSYSFYTAPGEIFSYTSATEINTPDGYMFGSYQMVKNDKILFDAKIDKCMLNMPRTIH